MRASWGSSYLLFLTAAALSRVVSPARSISLPNPEIVLQPAIERKSRQNHG